MNLRREAARSWWSACGRAASDVRICELTSGSRTSRRVPPLRKWFNHDPAKWAAFRRCYTSELDANPQGWQPLADAARAGDITLLYSSRDRDHNNAVVLRDYLQSRLRNG